MPNLFDTGIRPIIDAHLLKLAQEKRDYGDYFSASQAGYCMRKVILDRLQIPYVTEDPRKQRVFTSGHIFHEWMQKLTRDAGISIAQELELIDEYLKVKGHIDDLVLISNPDIPSVIEVKDVKNPVEIREYQHLILYDYKTRNSKHFDYAKRPSHFHRMQLGTYMYMLRKSKSLPTSPNSPVKIFWGQGFQDLTEARTLNISKDDLRMAEVQYLWSLELEKDVVGYWRTIKGYWDKQVIPKCTCDRFENGFMAKEKFNPYFYEGEPCSEAWFTDKLPEGWRVL